MPLVSVKHNRLGNPISLALACRIEQVIIWVFWRVVNEEFLNRVNL